MQSQSKQVSWSFCTSSIYARVSARGAKRDQMAKYTSIYRANRWASHRKDSAQKVFEKKILHKKTWAPDSTMDSPNGYIRTVETIVTTKAHVCHYGSHKIGLVHSKPQTAPKYALW